MTIGQRIKRIRNFRGMTQQELGELINVQQGGSTRIGQYEIGYRVPNHERLILIAEALAVPAETLSPAIASTREELLQTILWWDAIEGGGAIYECIITWEIMKKKLITGEITEEEYFIWHLTHSSLPTA